MGPRSRIASDAHRRGREKAVRFIDWQSHRVMLFMHRESDAVEFRISKQLDWICRSWSSSSSVAACRGSLTVHGAHLICGWYSKIQLYIQRCCHPRFLHGSVRRSVRPLDSLAPCCSTKVQLRISDVLRCKGVINVWKQLGACILCSHNYFGWVSISCLPNHSLSAVHFVIKSVLLSWLFSSRAFQLAWAKISIIYYYYYYYYYKKYVHWHEKL